jgi:hypothetical protein
VIARAIQILDQVLIPIGVFAQPVNQLNHGLGVSNRPFEKRYVDTMTIGEMTGER